MSLIDEFLSQSTPPKKAFKLCIDEIARDRNQDVTDFREEARRSLHIPGANNIEEVNRAFMESVKKGIAEETGKQESETLINKFQIDKQCR